MVQRIVPILVLLVVIFGTTSTAFGQAPVANIQIIHNAADPGAAEVDVYLGTEKALDNFAFRTATPFIEVPANTDIVVGVAGPDSESSADILAPFTVNLAPGRYVIVANGVLNPDNFAANADPAAAPIAFNLYALDSVTAAAANDQTVDVQIFHGATDAPAVDVRTGGSNLVESLSYGEGTTTISVPAASYVIDIAPAGADPIVSYTADLSGLGGASLMVVASGFLDPSANQNGPAFGLWVATADGGSLIELPVYTAPTTATIQIIHNAADPGAAEVDVYLGTEKALDNFAFRTATPFIEVPANTDIVVGVAGPDSESSADILAPFTVNLAPGRYVIVANGVLNPDNFAANADPAAAPIAFNLYSVTDVRESAIDDQTVEFIAFHGATDAPAVDIRYQNMNLVESLSYAQVSEYIAVPAGSYVIDIAPAGGDVLASFVADATNLGGGAAVVVASGFLNPAANQNGAAFGLWLALPSGGELIELPPVAVSVHEEAAVIPSASIRPNPASSGAEVVFSLPVASEATITISSTMGTVLLERPLGMLSSGEHRAGVDMSLLPSGTHYVTITAGTLRSTLPFAVVK